MLLALATGPAAAAAPLEPRAIVTVPAQGARLWRAGTAHPLAVLQLLRQDDEVRLAGPVQVEIAFLAGVGRVFVLRGPGSFRVGAQEVSAVGAAATPQARDLAPQWRALRIDPARLGRASVSLRGPQSEPLELLQPRGLERAARVAQLRWRRPAGRAQARWEYTVRITDGRGAQVYAATTPLEALSLPPEVQPVPGQAYAWMVEGVCDDGRRAQALAPFTLADPLLEARLAGLSAAHTGGPVVDPLAEDVLYALALAQEGLREESDAVLRARALPDWPLYLGVDAP